MKPKGLHVQNSKDKLLTALLPVGSHLAHWMLSEGFQAG